MGLRKSNRRTHAQSRINGQINSTQLNTTQQSDKASPYAATAF